MAEFVTVAKTTEIKPGLGIVTEAGGKTLAVFNVDGAFHVIDNTCVHRGGPLGEGELEGDIVSCPWHGWQFNVKTGGCVANPAAKVAVYESRVVGEEIQALL
ncbi:MAG: Rieske 2Fe-2S domain-containing protein [Nitrospiraceae bacterium]